MEVSTIFAARLKALREKGGLSQIELAKELKVSRGAISFYENGDRVPNIEFLGAVAMYFNVPLDYLMGLQESCEENKTVATRLCFLSDEAIYNLSESYYPELVNELLSGSDFEEFLGMFELLTEIEYAKAKTGKEETYDVFHNTIDRDYVIFKMTKLLLSALSTVAARIAYKDFTPDDFKRLEERYQKTTEKYEETKREAREQADRITQQYKKENQKRLDALSKIHPEKKNDATEE